MRAHTGAVSARGKYHRCAQTRRLHNRREKERPKVLRGGGRKVRARGEEECAAAAKSEIERLKRTKQR